MLTELEEKVFQIYQSKQLTRSKLLELEELKKNYVQELQERIKKYPKRQEELLIRLTGFLDLVKKIKRRSHKFEAVTPTIFDQLYQQRPLAIEWKMAAFDYKTALQLPELSECSSAKIGEFLDAIECYHDTLSESGKQQLVNFIVKTKIKGTAQTRLGSREGLDSFSLLRTACESKVMAQETSEALRAKINQARQGRHSLDKYAEYLSDLAESLAAAKIRENEIN